MFHPKLTTVTMLLIIIRSMKNWAQWQIFDELVAKAHALGLDIILDFVMNHTSDQHPWFQAALKDKDSEFRNCYLWHQGKNGGPPNNWGLLFLAEVCGKRSS